MQSKHNYYALLLGLLLTIIAVSLYDAIPEKRLVLDDSTFVEKDVFSDGLVGGESSHRWENKSKNHFECRIGKYNEIPRYCGIILRFSPHRDKGRDISGFHSLQMHIEYSGTGKDLMATIRSRNHDLKGVDYENSIVASTYRIQRSEFNKPVTMKFEHFDVADWWTVRFKVKTRDALPNFKEVIGIGIDVPIEPEEGYHSVNISDLVLVGKWIIRENYYALILGIWIAALAIYSFAQIFYLQRQTEKNSQKVSELTISNEYLKYEADIYRQVSENDGLTGLLNREGLSSELNRSISQANLFDYGLILLDLDHFKDVNDEYGHDTGDLVLAKASEVLKENTRTNDIVARWGGEEFLIISLSRTLQDAEQLAEKIRKKLELVTFDQYPELHLSGSFGVTMADKKEQFEDAFKRVDKAMYQAKENGRNTVVVLS